MGSECNSLLNLTRPNHSASKVMETTSFLPMILVLALAAPASLCTSNPNQTDRMALYAFKDFITEDPLGVLSFWNNSVHVCQWHGVKCGRRHPRVVELDLRSRRLAGTISPSIGNLSFLRSIFLQENQFRGGIPHEIGHLSRLQNLNLSYNTLQQEIPSNLSLCLNLQVVDFGDNGLVGKIPPELGSLSKLTTLYVLVNNLHGVIPPSFANLSLLQIINVGYNNLEGTIPESIGHLRNLRFFAIGQNKISGTVPPSIYNISSLVGLFLFNNQLTGSLPSDIGLAFPNLGYVTVGGNRFTGRFPASLSNASGMRALDLISSGLSGPVPADLGRRMNQLWWLNLADNLLGTGVVGDLGFIDSLTNCTKLNHLDISGNGFGGVFPNSITNLSAQLASLSAETNQFVGKIPDAISNLVNLQSLDLSQNLLSGSIPSVIGMLQNLQGIALDDNQLSGSIPESIGNLTRISVLNLQGNNLKGSLPGSLENIKGLQIFNLSHNSLGGSVPKTIGVFYTIIYINLAHNSFNGSLPSELGNLNNLQQLDISDNDLSGELPTTLGKCLAMEVLLMSSNSFNGSIPSSFASLKGLVELDLSHNNLSGKIPVQLEKLSVLEKLDLSFNNLEGEMPLKGGFTNTSVVSIVGNMNLCGGVPDLHLPACPILQSKKKNKRLAIKLLIILIAVALCLVILMFVVAIYWKRKPRKASPEKSLGEEYFRVSYDDLLKATDGFSSNNLLGVGSFGSVYKGILYQNEKPIAVKVFNLERLGASESFFAECDALRQTRHRNLLKIITACSSIDFQGNDFKALVFEFMHNGSLESWLHPSDEEDTTKKLNLTQRLNIVIDVVSALEYLHHHCETPIVHCDLKPSNVLLDEDMIAHVGDFGLAKFLAVDISNPSEQHTNSIAIKGSIGYVAPEYGMGGIVSAQGDIYSYGVLLLEILTGKRPTDEIFKDGLSLHSFCKMALPDRVMEITDPRLLILEEEELDDQHQIKRSRGEAKVRECLISLVRIGVACSMETPRERMGISEIMELKAVKQAFLGVAIHGGQRSVRM